MGLNITVYKPFKPTQEQIDEVDTKEFGCRYRALSLRLDPLKGLDVFVHLAIEKEIEYYNSVELFGFSSEDDLQERASSIDWDESVYEAMDRGEEPDFDNVDLVCTLKDGTKIKRKYPNTTAMDLRLYVEEIMDQRKGANSAFYDEGIWDHPPILDRATLLLHWDKYFSGDTIKEKMDQKPEFLTGLGTEYALDSATNRARFKENILDKFIEGEHFVVYH
jgi:hypothetical protein